MQRLCHSSILIWIGLLVLKQIVNVPVLGAVVAGDARDRAAEPAEQVTILGMVLNHVHTGEKDPSVFVYALDGPPQIKSEFEKIMAEYYPDRGSTATRPGHYWINSRPD